jgi:hypothetical protein
MTGIELHEEEANIMREFSNLLASNPPGNHVARFLENVQQKFESFLPTESLKERLGKSLTDYLNQLSIEEHRKVTNNMVHSGLLGLQIKGRELVSFVRRVYENRLALDPEAGKMYLMGSTTCGQRTCYNRVKQTFALKDDDPCINHKTADFDTISTVDQKTFDEMRWKVVQETFPKIQAQSWEDLLNIMGDKNRTNKVKLDGKLIRKSSTIRSIIEEKLLKKFPADMKVRVMDPIHPDDVSNPAKREVSISVTVEGSEFDPALSDRPYVSEDDLNVDIKTPKGFQLMQRTACFMAIIGLGFTLFTFCKELAASDLDIVRLSFAGASTALSSVGVFHSFQESLGKVDVSKLSAYLAAVGGVAVATQGIYDLVNAIGNEDPVKSISAAAKTTGGVLIATGGLCMLRFAGKATVNGFIGSGGMIIGLAQVGLGIKELVDGINTGSDIILPSIHLAATTFFTGASVALMVPGGQLIALALGIIGAVI